MVALQLGWQDAEALEMQRSYMVQSPRRGCMKLNIGFQSFFGLARILDNSLF